MEIAFHLVRNGNKEADNQVEVGGRKDVGELRNALIKAGKDPNWTMLSVHVFDSLKKAKEGKVSDEVRDKVEREGGGGLNVHEQLGATKKLDPKKTYFIVVPSDEEEKEKGLELIGGLCNG